MRHRLKVPRDMDAQRVISSGEVVHPSIRPGAPRFLNSLNNWLPYQTCGTPANWCDEFVEPWMADNEYAVRQRERGRLVDRRRISGAGDTGWRTLLWRRDNERDGTLTSGRG